MKIDRMISNFFIPKKREKIFDIHRYIEDLKKGLFDDHFNLGVSEENNGKWQLKNFEEEPHALFVGATGSGKSQATKFTVLTWLLANNQKTILFVTDPSKGAQDYADFFDQKNVFTGFTSDEFHKIIQLVYDEAIARTNEFKRLNIDKISSYERETGKQMTRIIVVMEEFHFITSQLLNFQKEFKEPGTTANTLHTLMRIGRSMGIWFIAASQKSTKSDIPSEMVGSFTQKQIFKVSQAESQYVLQHTEAASLESHEKGRCYISSPIPTQVQFPFLGDKDESVKTIEDLIKDYMKPYNEAKSIEDYTPGESFCMYLSLELIEDFLSGTTTEDMYKHKSFQELIESIDKPSIDANVVISMMHKAANHKVQTFESNLEPNGVTHIVTYPNGERVAICIKKGIKKLMQKHLIQFAKGIAVNDCAKGIMYLAMEGTPTQAMYSYAVKSLIELVDKEDMLRQGANIDHAIENNEDFEIDAEKIASDAKEDGSHFQINEKNSEISEEKSEEKIAKEEKVDSFLDDIDITDKEEDLNEEDEMPDIIPLKDPKARMEEIILDNPRIQNTKKIKRPSVQTSFNLKNEDSVTLMIHALKTKNKEVYRYLFYTIVEDEIKHKYYIDKEINDDFSYNTKIALGITDTTDWNNDPLVLDEEKFNDILNKYFSNFSRLDSPVYVVCSQEDEEDVTELIKERSKFLQEPTILEEELAEIYGNNGSKQDLISSNNITSEKQDIWEAIDLDFKLWTLLI